MTASYDHRACARQMNVTASWPCIDDIRTDVVSDDFDVTTTANLRTWRRSGCSRTVYSYRFRSLYDDNAEHCRHGLDRSNNNNNIIEIEKNPWRNPNAKRPRFVFIRSFRTHETFVTRAVRPWSLEDKTIQWRGLISGVVKIDESARGGRDGRREPELTVASVITERQRTRLGPVSERFRQKNKSRASEKWMEMKKRKKVNRLNDTLKRFGWRTRIGKPCQLF